MENKYVEEKIRNAFHWIFNEDMFTGERQRDISSERGQHHNCANSMEDIPAVINATSAINTAHVSRTGLKHLSRTTISALQLDTPTEGQYLLLRTLEPACLIVAIHTYVEDHVGEKILFCAYNMMVQTTEDCREVFPIGTIFILKEPYRKISASGEIMLRCESPSDIIILQKGDKYYNLTDGVVWKNRLCSMTFPDTEYGKQYTPEEWKTLGNQMFTEQKYIHAARFYKNGLLEAEKSKDVDLCKILQLNLSATYLNSGWYELAITFAENALKIDPASQKAHFRAGRANYELRNYAKSREWYCKLLQRYPDCKEARTELQRCDSRLDEAQYGIHSVYTMMLERTYRPKTPIDCADYIGPIRVADIPGKGRGYVATKKLDPGTLLLVNKAIKVTWKKCEVTDTHLIIAVANVLMKNPNTFGHTIYNLPAGYSESEFSDPVQVFCDPDLREEPIADIDRIRDILRTHYFDTLSGLFEFQISRYHMSVLSKGTPRNADMRGMGLFALASFFKRRCIASASYDLYNDVLLVRASQTIQEGEEVSLLNFNFQLPYSFRMGIFQSLPFNCDCQLCTIDLKEPPYFRLSRMELLMSRKLDSHSLQGMEDFVKNVKSTYEKSNRKEFRVELFWTYVDHGMLYLGLNLYNRATKCFLNAIRLLGLNPDEIITVNGNGTEHLLQSTWPNYMLMFCMPLVTVSYCLSGNIFVAKKWAGVMIAYEEIFSGCGDVNFIKCKYPIVELCNSLVF